MELTDAKIWIFKIHRYAGFSQIRSHFILYKISRSDPDSYRLIMVSGTDQSDGLSELDGDGGSTSPQD